jgi:hypothetical protein
MRSRTHTSRIDFLREQKNNKKPFCSLQDCRRENHIQYPRGSIVRYRLTTKRRERALKEIRPQ